MNNPRTRNIYLIPYVCWIVLFVVAPIVLVFYYSFFDIEGNFTFGNYVNFFTPTYLKMTFSSFWYAFLITGISLFIGYPTALFINENKAQTTLVIAYYFAIMDQFAIKGLCIFRHFWCVWCRKSIP